MMIAAPFPSLRTLVFAASLLVTAASLAEESSGETRKDKPGMSKERVRDKGDVARLEVWESLSPEQRDKLKQALRDVWTDPAVISAREEVKQAGDAYQVAIKAAVSRADPSVAEVMSKIQRSNSGMAHEHIWGRPPMSTGQTGNGIPQPPHGQGPSEKGGPGPRRGFDDQIKPPGFLDNLPPESRDKFRQAEESALASDAVKVARAELEKIREEGESLRRKRLEAHRTLRKVTLDEMIRIDPSIAGIRKKLSGEERGGPNMAPRKEGPKNKDPKAEDKRPDRAVVPADRAP